MKLENLLSIPRGTPFYEVIKHPYDGDYISPFIYKTESGIYLQSSSFRPGSLEIDSDGPFIVGIILAASDGSVRRALLLDIESDDGKSISGIPTLFFTSEDTLKISYKYILSELKKTKPKVCQEKAAYRLASDGKFIHRIIETERFLFFFRNSKNDDEEIPYAIIRKLV